jgi:hypothetical protein
MPWTIPNLVLHDNPPRLGNVRSHGRKHVFVVCGNRHCPHNAELDVISFPDDMIYGDLQPRMLCTVCDHLGADVGPHGCIMADWSPEIADPASALSCRPASADL